MSSARGVTRTALIDGDICAWKAAAIIQRENGDEMELHQLLRDFVIEWQNRAMCSELIVCLSGSDGFRYEVAENYKAHRQTHEPPPFKDLALEILENEFRSVRRPKLEADDIMGILATNGSVENPIIVTVDKDLRQVPGWHCNPDKDAFPVRVTQPEADYFFCFQWLTGDPTDGIPGLPGVGPKKAEKILSNGSGLKDWVAAVVEAFRGQGYEDDYILQQARLVRILRAEDWDPEQKTYIPWEWAT